jgi:hypothetical protein
MDEEQEYYEKIIHQDDTKSFQLRLVVNTFKERTYVHLRKYFLSYEGEFVASKEGVSMEASLDSILSLLDGLMEIVSHEEARDTVLKHFEEFTDKK